MIIFISQKRDYTEKGAQAGPSPDSFIRGDSIHETKHSNWKN